MKNWMSLLTRHGFEKEDLHTQSTRGTYLNRALMIRDIKEHPTTDAEWISTLKHSEREFRVGREMLIDPLTREVPLADLDPYIRGVVQWMNKLGIYTTYSCDGHNRRPAFINFKNYITTKQMNIIQACIVSGVRVRFSGKKVSFFYEQGEIERLLDIAENLYLLTKSPEKLIALEADQFKPLLLDLLSITGASGNERRITQYLRGKLRKLTDYTHIDRSGNLLGYLNCGEGPTVLLSAHMDTVEEFSSSRKIIEDGTFLSSSEGILGADDRAGIAVILKILAGIQRTNFNGTIKIALTVQEEIGCVGSRNIDQIFLDDVDGAIVVDRRGTRDIVTSYAGLTPFCPKSYGEIFEKAGVLAKMTDWKTTQGGLSDAKVFSEQGIPSVNLSVGYKNEHTDNETVDYKATYETVKLIEAVLHHQLIKERNVLNTAII